MQAIMKIYIFIFIQYHLQPSKYCDYQDRI
jgi:hypothetical protein